MPKNMRKHRTNKKYILFFTNFMFIYSFVIFYPVIVMENRLHWKFIFIFILHSSIQICARLILQYNIFKYELSKQKTTMPRRHAKRKQTPDLQQTQLYDKVTKLQSQILIRLQWLNKKKYIKFDCTHCRQTFDEPYDLKTNYYDKFWKCFCINQICLQRYKNYQQWINKVNRKVSQMQRLFKQRQELIGPHLSRRKRKFIPLTKQYECQICQKKYDDQEGLEIHVSMKHSAEQIKLEAKIEEIDMPNIDYRLQQKSQLQHQHFLQKQNQSNSEQEQEEQQEDYGQKRVRRIQQ